MDAKLLSSLQPMGSAVRIHGLRVEPDEIVAEAEILTAMARCPHCGDESRRIHSKYARRLSDLPCVGRRLQLVVTVHRFFCDNTKCPRRVFCERIEGMAATYARTTAPLTQSHQGIGLALGGEAGARLARKLSMPTSADTLIRRVRGVGEEPGPPPRFVGVDDWAIRKGQRYGTILIDLERSRVIDVFPGRDGEALKEWFRANPQVKVIARDRWSAYAKASTEGAPQATQVADRWHLLKNLREAIERLFARFSPEIREATLAASTSASEEIASAPVDVANAPVTAATTFAASNEAVAGNQQARQERHRQARQLHAEGHSIRSIARRIRCNRETVRRYLTESKCPDWSRRKRTASQLDEHRQSIEAWIGEGGRHWTDLYRVLKRQGMLASYDAVRRYVRSRYGNKPRLDPRTKSPPPRPLPTPPTARSLSFSFIRRPQTPSVNASPTLLERLREGIPGLNVGLGLASEFASMVRKTLDQPLDQWLSKVAESDVKELKNFAAGLRDDKLAVANAMTERWSSGPVEGHVHRLKQIKRSMYGRAGLDLLMARVVHKG